MNASELGEYSPWTATCGYPLKLKTILKFANKIAPQLPRLLNGRRQYGGGLAIVDLSGIYVLLHYFLKELKDEPLDSNRILIASTIGDTLFSTLNTKDQMVVKTVVKLVLGDIKDEGFTLNVIEQIKTQMSCVTGGSVFHVLIDYDVS